MGKAISQRLLFYKNLYAWGWRWIVFVIWVLPYGAGAIYDFLQGQGFLPADYPNLSSIVPDWLPPVWFFVGLITFVLVTIEGAYRISHKKIEQSSEPHEYIPDTYIRGRLLNLMDLLSPSSEPIISNRTIEDCEIRGPVMISLIERVTIYDSGFDGDVESLFVEVAGERIIFGAVGLRDCVFRRCHFAGVGIIGSRAQINELKKGFASSASYEEGLKPE